MAHGRQPRDSRTGNRQRSRPRSASGERVAKVLHRPALDGEVAGAVRSEHEVERPSQDVLAGRRASVPGVDADGYVAKAVAQDGAVRLVEEVAVACQVSLDRRAGAQVG